MFRPALVCFALLATACGGGARRINPDLADGPRRNEPALSFQFTCTYVPGPRRAPASALRLCAARSAEDVAAKLVDGALRVRIRFRDTRGHRLDLYFHRENGRTLRGAVLVERLSVDERIEIEPDRGWIAVDHLDMRGKAAAGRYALTFGSLRIGGSFSVGEIPASARRAPAKARAKAAPPARPQAR